MVDGRILYYPVERRCICGCLHFAFRRASIPPWSPPEPTLAERLPCAGEGPRRLQKGQHYALDDLCDPDGDVALGNGDKLHAGRFYPYPAAACNRVRIDPCDSGPKPNLEVSLTVPFEWPRTAVCKD